MTVVFCRWLVLHGSFSVTVAQFQMNHFLNLPLLHSVSDYWLCRLLLQTNIRWSALAVSTLYSQHARGCYENTCVRSRFQWEYRRLAGTPYLHHLQSAVYAVIAIMTQGPYEVCQKWTGYERQFMNNFGRRWENYIQSYLAKYSDEK
jgi:hypothetical protein